MKTRRNYIGKRFKNGSICVSRYCKTGRISCLGNTYSIIRGAAWKLRNWNQAGVFEDGNKIYATEKLQEKIPNADFTVEYEGSRELPVLENRRIYQELIKYWITQKLSQILIFGKYRKYSCKSNVTSKWIMTNQGFETFSSGNREISLERKYNFWVTIMDDEKAYLRIDTSSLFFIESNCS